MQLSPTQHWRYDMLSSLLTVFSIIIQFDLKWDSNDYIARDSREDDDGGNYTWFWWERGLAFRISKLCAISKNLQDNQSPMADSNFYPISKSYFVWKIQKWKLPNAKLSYDYNMLNEKETPIVCNSFKKKVNKKNRRWDKSMNKKVYDRKECAIIINTNRCTCCVLHMSLIL